MKQKLIAAASMLAVLLALFAGCAKNSSPTPTPAPPQSHCMLTKIAAPIVPDSMVYTFAYTNNKIAKITYTDYGGGLNGGADIIVYDYAYATDGKLKSIIVSENGTQYAFYTYYTDTTTGGVIIPTVKQSYPNGNQLNLYYTKKFYNASGQLTSIRTDSSDGHDLYYVSGDSLYYPSTGTANYTKIFHRYGIKNGNGVINYFTDTYNFTYDDKPSPLSWPEVSGYVSYHGQDLDYSFFEPTTNNVTSISYNQNSNNGSQSYTQTFSYTYNSNGYPLTQHDFARGALINYYTYANCQ